MVSNRFTAVLRCLQAGLPGLLLLVIVVSGGVARKISDEGTPLDSDEGISLLAAACHQRDYRALTKELSAQWIPAQRWHAVIRPQQWCLGEVSRGLARTDVHPPAYFWLLHAAQRLGGAGPSVGIWLNLSLYALSALALYGCARRVFAGKLAALSTVAIWAASSQAMKVTGLLRPYELSSLSAIVFILALITSEEREHVWRRRIALVLASALAALTHYNLAVIVLAGGGLCAYQAALRRTLRPAIWTSASVGTGVVLAALLFDYSRQLGRAGLQHGFTQELWAQYVKRLATFFDPLAVAPWLSAQSAAVLLALAGVVVSTVALVRGEEDRHTLPLPLLVAIIATLAHGLLYGVSVMPEHAIGPRYFAALFPWLSFLPVIAARVLWRAAPLGYLCAIYVFAVAAASALPSERTRARRAAHSEVAAPLIALDTTHRLHLPRFLTRFPAQSQLFVTGSPSTMSKHYQEFTRPQKAVTYVTQLSASRSPMRNKLLSRLQADGYKFGRSKFGRGFALYRIKAPRGESRAD